MRNYGFNILKELADEKDTDFIGGSEVDNLTSITLVSDISEDQELIKYLPTGEVQTGNGDMMDCASRGPTNLLETKLNYWLRSKNMSLDNIDWLNQNGFIDANGNISVSDAFSAILSNTTANGNSLKAPLDSLRKNGFIPKKLLPLESWMTQRDYLNPKRITQKMRDLGKEAVRRFPLNYIRYSKEDFPNIRKYDMIDVAGFAWPEPVNGIYPKVWNQPANHCFVDIPKTPQYTIFDNYIDSVDQDFIKRLASDYNLYDVGYRLLVNENVFSFELTCEMVRFIYLLREDVRKEFPASNQFNSINDPTKKYSIYDWCRRFGWKENPDIFLKHILDFSTIKVSDEITKEAELIQPEPEKKNWWEQLIRFVKDIFNKLWN